jgi:hypothetical protein
MNWQPSSNITALNQQINNKTGSNYSASMGPPRGSSVSPVLFVIVIDRILYLFTFLIRQRTPPLFLCSQDLVASVLCLKGKTMLWDHVTLPHIISLLGVAILDFQVPVRATINIADRVISFCHIISSSSFSSSISSF